MLAIPGMGIAVPPKDRQSTQCSPLTQSIVWHFFSNLRRMDQEALLFCGKTRRFTLRAVINTGPTTATKALKRGHPSGSRVLRGGKGETAGDNGSRGRNRSGANLSGTTVMYPCQWRCAVEGAAVLIKVIHSALASTLMRFLAFSSATAIA